MACPGGERRVPLDVRTVEMVDEPTYVRHKITYAREPWDRVPTFTMPGSWQYAAT